MQKKYPEQMGIEKSNPSDQKKKKRRNFKRKGKFLGRWKRLDKIGMENNREVGNISNHINELIMSCKKNNDLSQHTKHISSLSKRKTIVKKNLKPMKSIEVEKEEDVKINDYQDYGFNFFVKKDNKEKLKLPEPLSNSYISSDFSTQNVNILEEKGSLYLNEGSFSTDTPHKIISVSVYKESKLNCLVSWFPRKNGFVAQPTYYSNKVLKKKNINLLLDYYENKIIYPV
jgi:hypothetical protein